MACPFPMFKVGDGGFLKSHFAQNFCSAGTCSCRSSNCRLMGGGLHFFFKIAITRLWRFVATAFRKKVGMIISIKSNLVVCVLFSLTCKNCHLLTQISPPVCLSPSLFLPLKPPVPVNDRPIILVPFSRNVFSPKRLFKLHLQECYRTGLLQILHNYVCRYLISTIKV